MLSNTRYDKVAGSLLIISPIIPQVVLSPLACGAVLRFWTSIPLIVWILVWITAFAMMAWIIYFCVEPLAPKVLQRWNQHKVLSEDIGAMQKKAS